jgi:exodeoxyribonuclease V gamma subunit
LQPFSRRYFGEDAMLFSYAREWVENDVPANDTAAKTLAKAATATEARESQTITPEMLSRFLRDPVKYFFNQRLKVYLDEATETLPDSEPFQPNHLEEHLFKVELLNEAKRNPNQDPEKILQAATGKLQRCGSLPLAEFGQRYQMNLREPLPAQLRLYAALCQNWPQLLESPKALRFEEAGLRLEGVLGGLRQNGDGHLAYIELSPGTLKNNRWKWHRLLPAYVRHVAAAACDIELTSLLVGEGEEPAHFKPLSTTDASRILIDWLDAWQEGMGRPLPIARKTAFAWLDGKDKAMEKAATAYEGGFNFDGEASQSPTLARVYPDFAALKQERDGEFFDWIERLYAPLYNEMSGAKA